MWNMYGSVFVDDVGVFAVDVVFAALLTMSSTLSSSSRLNLRLFPLAAILIGEVATSHLWCCNKDGVVCDETSSLDLEFLVCLGISCLELVT